MRSAAALAIIIGVSTTCAKVDRLVSKRHQKRLVDEAGLYVRGILIFSLPKCIPDLAFLS